MSRVSLVIHGAGLLSVYSLYGLLQEKIIKTTYGPNAQRFDSTSLLILCNRLFAMVIAIIIMVIKRKGRGSLYQALKPTSPLSSFAIVAGFNFIATSCQYLALQHLSFTTTSLGKCVKMIPILLVQRLIHHQIPRNKDWVAAGTIAIGCATYLSTIRTPSPLENDAAFIDAVLGCGFLFGYLLFDSLTSTSQERLFGRNTSSIDPFSNESNVLPQMVYVNIFSSIFSFIGVLSTFKQGRTPASILLLMHDQTLQIDVLLLSATAALGLIILLNSIASFGALTTSLMMTIRQFLGILLNYGVFNHGTVGMEGWCGIGWVASGVYIKMNKTYDTTDQPLVKTVVSDEEVALCKETGSSGGRRSPSPDPAPPYVSDESPSNRRLFFQYVFPIFIPILISSLIWIVTPKADNFDMIDNKPIEGRLWEKELHTTLLPECAPSNSSGTIRWPGKRRTILASFPRSGNSLVRELVERATNYQTSTVSYCDEFLRESFIGECDHKANFLSKSHYPWKVADKDLDYRKKERYDQAVHLIRNPIDALNSDYHLAASPKTATGQLQHGNRVKIGLLGSTQGQRDFILRRATIWQHHEKYWHSIPFLVHSMRYEDLITDRLTTMLSLVAFLLPKQEERPDLTDMSCMTELDEARQAYKSRKVNSFNSWDLWEPKLRDEVLEITKLGWCRSGYQKLLEDERPEVTSGIVC